MATITLDGRATEAREGATVLEVARAAGVEIPTLCHHEALGPYGACRLCLVEAEGPTLRRGLVTACTLPASDGLRVDTRSEAVRRARRVVLELLLGRSPRSEPLRALARRHGVESTRFGAGRAVEEACVRCGLCVRACRDELGASALVFAGRGQRRRVATEFGQLSGLCIGCASCAAICPTGAIRVRDEGGERTILHEGRAIATLPLVPCGSCGAPFAPQRLLDSLAPRLAALPAADGGRACPDCRRARGAAALAEGRPA